MASTLRILALLVVGMPAAWGGILGPPDVTCEYKDESAYGLVLFSVSIPESGIPNAPRSIGYRYNKSGATFLSDAGVSISRIGPLYTSVKSDFDGLFGKLYVLRLKAGDYEFRDWRYIDWMNREHRPVSLGKISFRVTAGRATYLGSFDPQLSVGKNMLGLAAADIWPTVIDQHQRDLEIFSKKCPAFDVAVSTDIEVMDPSPWMAK